MPDFVGSPERFTSTSAGIVEPLRRRLGPERVAELAQLADRLRLAALQVADEVPAEAVAVARVLRLEILRAVLADDLDTRGRERVERVDARRTSSRRRPSPTARPPT